MSWPRTQVINDMIYRLPRRQTRNNVANDRTTALTVEHTKIDKMHPIDWMHSM